MLTSSSWSSISPIVTKGFARPFQPSGILPSALRQHPLTVEPPPQGPLLPEGKDTRDQCGLSSQAPHILSLTSNSSSPLSQTTAPQCSGGSPSRRQWSNHLPPMRGSPFQVSLCSESPSHTQSTFSKENPIQTFSLFFPFVLVPFIEWHWAAARVANP